MIDTVLLVTQTRLSDTYPIVEALNSEFDNPNIIIYAIGRKRTDFKRTVEHLNVYKTSYDYDIVKNHSKKPDYSYLRKFEDSFDDNSVLNTCISVDRKIIKNGQIGLFHEEKSQFGYEETLCQVEARTRTLSELFSEYNIDLVFGRRTEVLAGMIAYYLAKREGIPFFRRQHTRVKDKYILHDNPFEYSDWFWSEYQHARQEQEDYPTYTEAREYLEQVRSGKPIYNFGSSITGNRSSTMIQQLKSVFEVLQAERGGITKTYYYDTPKFKYVSKVIQKKINRWYLNNVCSFPEFQLDEEYVYFPLQAQPELSLMLWTKYFTEQRELMQYVAKSLPLHQRLYVNDHPLQWGERSASYYQHLNNQYNISVLPVSVNTRELIDNAETVVTITSSVGFEALMYDTPVVTFGREKYAPFYANFDSVLTVDRIYDLPDTIDAASDQKIDETELIAYIATALEVGMAKEEGFYDGLFETIHNKHPSL